MIPDYQTAMLPTLRSLGDGAVRTAQDVRDFVAREFKVTEEELRELVPSARRRCSPTASAGL
jgi:restriction system protein